MAGIIELEQRRDVIRGPSALVERNPMTARSWNVQTNVVAGLTMSGIHAPGRPGATRSCGRRTVTFRLSAEFGAAVAEVAGDFSAWAPLAMLPDGRGGFRLDLGLDGGRQFRYRFLLDGERWINDPLASDFIAGPNGSAASMIVT
jgi:hypothetical protein